MSILSVYGVYGSSGLGRDGLDYCMVWHGQNLNNEIRPHVRDTVNSLLMVPGV
jgi:hypothetical protein